MEDIANKKRGDDLLDFVVEKHDMYLEAQQLHKNGLIEDVEMKGQQDRAVSAVNTICAWFRPDLDLNTYEIDLWFKSRPCKISGKCYLSETRPDSDCDGNYINLVDANIEHINETLRTYNPRAYNAFGWFINCLYSQMEDRANKWRASDLLNFLVGEHEKYLEAKQLHKNGRITDVEMKYRQKGPVNAVHSKSEAFRSNLEFNTYEIDFLLESKPYKISGKCLFSETKIELGRSHIEHIEEDLFDYNLRAFAAVEWLIDCLYSRTPR